MAISTPTTLTFGGSTPNSSSYSTAPVTLTANRLYIIVANGYRSGGGTIINAITHDPAGTPLSFVNITGSLGNNEARVHQWDTTLNRTLAAWYVVPTSTTGNEIIRIDWAAGQSACGWRVIEIESGFDNGGTDLFTQVSTLSGSGITPSASMATFAATDNLLLMFIGWGTGTSNPTQTISPTEGRTELGEHNDGERGSQGVHYQNPHGGDTTINATLSGTNDWGVIGIEVKASGGEPPPAGRPPSQGHSQAVLIGFF